jgi:cytochrome c peroxidase
MRLSLSLLLLFIASVTIGALHVRDHQQARSSAIREHLAAVSADLDRTMIELQTAAHHTSDTLDVYALRTAYEHVRAAYKRLEPFAEYVDPEYVTSWINGAPLPRIDVKSQFHDVLQPVGLQVLDELLHGDATTVLADRASIDAIIGRLTSDMRALDAEVRSVRYTDRMLIEMTRMATMRVMSMGITGFDRPASEPSMADDTAALGTIELIMDTFAEVCAERGIAHAATARSLARTGSIRLAHARSFDDFDRADFIRDVLDPLYGALYNVQRALQIETSSEISSAPTALEPTARSMFLGSTLNPLYGTGLPRTLFTPDAIELGRSLFFDPVLSADLDRACASCHQPERAFADGQRTSIARGGKDHIDRNAPALIDAVFARRFFHDLRAQRLDDVIEHVVSNKREFGSTPSEMVERLRQSTEYRALFKAVFAQEQGDPVNVANVGRAISAYLAGLVSFDSPVDRYLRGETSVLDPSVRRGMNLFMGRAACATCHFPPTFAGYVPPQFLSTESEILGVPSQPDTVRAFIDADIGRAGGIHREHVDIYRNSFKTPTVRNVALTAPYMHNGVYATLEQVVDFYDRGGGLGIGIDHPHQTLASDRLQFTKRDHRDLIAFMRALTDTSGLTARPVRLPRMDDPRMERRTIGGDY